MRRFLGISVTVAVFASGCAFTFDGQRKVTRKPLPSTTRPRADALPGTARLQANGTLQFTLDAAKLCQRDIAIREEIGIDKAKRFSPLGIGVLAASIAVIPISIYGFTTIDPGPSGSIDKGEDILKLTGGVFAIIGGGIGTGFLLAFRYSDGTYPASKGYEKIETRDIQDRSEVVGCTNGVADVGELALTTPWGAQVKATPRGDGNVTFPIDWSAERAGALSTQQLAGEWTITATSRGTQRWNPSGEDAQHAANLIAAARERVVVGTTPAQLTASVQPVKAIEIGGSGQLLVTMTNTGASTATKVTAKTRSSIAALHGQALTFGTIQPGATATRTVDVKLPEDITDDFATVIVTFTEGSGNAPAEIVAKFPLARAMCPGGRLTRAKYDEKRAKLKKALDAGGMTQEDFDRFDADLVRCLD